MAVQSHLLDNKKSKGGIFQFLLKTMFVLCVLVLVTLTVLANMGGSNDMLKGGIEGYLSRLFGGRPAKIETLHNMSFFPSVKFDFSDAYIMEGPQGAVSVARIGHLKASMKFWKVFLGYTDFREFSVEDFTAIRGLLLPYEVKIERMYVDHDIETQQAYMRGVGSIGVHPLEFALKLDVLGNKKPYSYRFSGDSNFDIKLSDLHIRADLIPHDAGYLQVSDLVIETADAEMTADLSLSMPEDGFLKIKGSAVIGRDQSEVTFDLRKQVSALSSQLSGSVSSDKVHAHDVFEEGGLVALYERLQTLLGYHQTHFVDMAFDYGAVWGVDLDLDFSLGAYHAKNDYESALSFSLIQKDGNLFASEVMSGEEKLLPGWAWLRAPSAEPGKQKRYAVIFGGGLDPDFSNAIGLDLPSQFVDKGTLLDCGIGSVVQDAANASRSAELALKTSSTDYITYAVPKEKSAIPFDLSELKEQSELHIDKITLPYEGYKLVQAYIQKSPQGSACDQYLKKVDAPQIIQPQQQGQQ